MSAAPMRIEDMVDARRLARLRRIVVASCFLVLFFDGYDTNLLGYVAPALIAHFQITKAAFGTVISAGLVGFMVGALGLGELGDRFGRKRMIVAGTMIFGVLTLLCAWTGSLAVFVVLRFLAGLGLGGAIPNAVALNAEFAPRRAEATVIGFMFVGYTLGGAAPGLVASAVLNDFGWQAVFYVGAVLPLLLGLAMLLFLPESIRFLAARNRLGALRKLTRRDGFGPAPQPGGGFAMPGGAVPQRAPTAQLFTEGRAPVTLLLWVAFVSCLTSVVFMIAWGPAIIVDLGFAPGRAALVGAMWQLGGAFGSVAVTRLLDRFGRRAVAACIVLAVPCIVLVGYVGQSQAALMAVILVGGFFGSGGQVGLNAVAGTVYPTFIRATGVGWAFGVGRVGAILGPLLGGLLIAGGLPPRTLLLTMSLPLIVAAACAALLAVRASPAGQA